jgi:hypothetical protein
MLVHAGVRPSNENIRLVGIGAGTYALHGPRVAEKLAMVAEIAKGAGAPVADGGLEPTPKRMRVSQEEDTGPDDDSVDDDSSSDTDDLDALPPLPPVLQRS